MTSRAGQALIRSTLDPRHDLIEESVAAIEREVRDDIRDAIAAIPRPAAMFEDGRPNPNGYEGGWNNAIEEVFAAISSSSATETQDGERLRPINHMTNEAIDGMVAALRKQFAIYHDEEAGVDVEDDAMALLDALVDAGHMVVPAPKAGVLGGYSWDCPNCGQHVTTWLKPPPLATPTPDDRDREVERIAALMNGRIGPDDVRLGRDLLKPAARLYDAGLRASGGN